MLQNEQAVGALALVAPRCLVFRDVVEGQTVSEARPPH